MLPILLQIETPIPGQEIYWIAVLMAGAIGVLFTGLIKALGQRGVDWKDLAEKAAVELSKTIDSLRSVTDAVEKRGSDTVAAVERNSQMLITIAGEVRKISESTARMEQRLDRLEGRLEARDDARRERDGQRSRGGS